MVLKNMVLKNNDDINLFISGDENTYRELIEK